MKGEREARMINTLRFAIVVFLAFWSLASWAAYSLVDLMGLWLTSVAANPALSSLLLFLTHIGEFIVIAVWFVGVLVMTFALIATQVLINWIKSQANVGDRDLQFSDVITLARDKSDIFR